MKTPTIFTLALILVMITDRSRAAPSVHNFLECLPQEFISNNVYTLNHTCFSSILHSSIHNLRFASDSTSKPSIIITPQHESQIPTLIYCAKESGLQIRTRSGGHDMEGLSYVAQALYAVIDLINLSQITVDAEDKTAWVGSGSTIGSLYYRIAEKSPVLGFPAGICHTVGVGGHFSGGGVGLLLRKYGLAADNVIDARIVDVNGRILDRKAMGEDLFWAIRGGGGASFGVILAWKLQLVDVPETVTIFSIGRTLDQNATQLVHRWQYIAPIANRDLFIGINIIKQNSTINVSFYSLFLGGTEALLVLMQEIFPELGLVREDCTEMSWIESMVNIAGFPIKSPPQVLLNRTNPYLGFFKEKSNYVQTPIPESGIEGIWRKLNEPEVVRALIQMSPHGGRMAEISESAIPFPHRAGNLYELLPIVTWQEEENQDSDKYIRWIRGLDDYLAPYVSRNPRGAYLNVRDLDIGVNNVEGETSYEQASIWGKRYFKNNFYRLVRVKTTIDLNNFFKNEQSIPPLH